MASNDMNSWGEDPDERLRRQWQQRFADFEVQARPWLSRRILTAQAAESHLQRSSRMVTLLLFLLLLGAGLMYPTRLGEQPIPRGRYAARALPPSPLQPQAWRRGTPPTAPSGRSKPTGLPVIDPLVTGPVIGWQPPAYASPPLGTVPSGMQASAIRRSPIGQLTGTTGSGRRVGLTSGRNSIRTRRLLATLIRSSYANALVRPSPPVTIGDYEWLPALAGPSINPDSLGSLSDAFLSIGQTPSTAFPTAIARLSPKGIRFLLRELHILPDQLPAIGLASQESSVPVANRRRYWFVKAVPLSSFQWMSTSPVSTAHVSHVTPPGAFSPATWGYQVYGGISLQRWRAYLAAGQLRQWAYYTVNQNSYRLEPTPTNPYLTVRETDIVVENRSLSVIGGGLSRVTFLAQGQYAVELGGQVSFLPANGQQMVSLRGGVDRRVAINRVLEFRLGLTAEYGVNRLTNDLGQLIIHPFLVGIGFQVQPRSLR